MRRHAINGWRSPLGRRLAAMAGGNSIAQVIILLFAPVITRIYSPDVFGLQGVFLAAVSLLSPVVALRFPMAIVLAKSDGEVRQIIRLSLLTTAALAGLLTIALLIFHDGVAGLLGLDGIGLLIYLLPVALVCVAWQDIVDYRAARRQQFGAVSVVTAVQALLINGARVVVGLFAPVGATLVALSTAGPALYATLLSLFTRDRTKTTGEKQPQKPTQSLRKLASVYRDFPLMRMPTDLLNAASQTIPVIMLSVLFTPAVAGFYTLARSVLNLPSNVIGNAIGNVFYAHFAELNRDRHSLGGLAVKSTVLLLIGPGLLIVLVCLFAPALFSFAFGDEWAEAGVYAQWMSLWIAVALANVPSVRLAPVIGRQGSLLLANALMLVSRVGSIILAALATQDPLVVVATYSVVSAFGNAVLIVWMLILTRMHDLRVRQQAVVDDGPSAAEQE